MSDDLNSDHKIKELEQERAILKKINESIEKKSKVTLKEKEKMVKELETLHHKTNEMEQTKKFLEKSILREEQKNNIPPFIYQQFNSCPVKF